MSDSHTSYPKAKPNYKAVGKPRLGKSSLGIVTAYMDFLEELSKEFGRNLSYEFNEYLKIRRSPTRTKTEVSPI